MLNVTKIDAKVPEAEARSLASFVTYFDEATVSIIDERFGGEESEDFYQGMLAGFLLALKLEADLDGVKLTESLFTLKYALAAVCLAKSEVSQPE